LNGFGAFCKNYETNKKTEKEKEKNKTNVKEAGGAVPTQPQIRPTAQHRTHMKRYDGFPLSL
jgi:hypothetical protein